MKEALGWIVLGAILALSVAGWLWSALRWGNEWTRERKEDLWPHNWD